MAQLCVLITFVSAIALSKGIQTKPICSQLGRYAFRSDMRDDLIPKFLVHEPKKPVSASLVYQCALEGMAGLILESPQKPLTCPNSLGMHSLIFEIDASSGVDFVEKLNNAAIDRWKDHIAHVTHATSFGCNHRKEDGKHKYLCLLK